MYSASIYLVILLSYCPDLEFLITIDFFNVTFYLQSGPLFNQTCPVMGSPLYSDKASSNASGIRIPTGIFVLVFLNNYAFQRSLLENQT